MDKENKVRTPENENAAEPVDSGEQQGKRSGLPVKDVSRYIRYVIFLVAVGLFYIWNSHVAEGRVREENKLRREITDAKAEYKTMHARLSAGTRKYVIADSVKALGLHATSENIYKLTRD